MTDSTTTWQPTLRWPSREQWTTMNSNCGIGAGPSYRLEDYATPQEIADILAALKPVRTRLYRQGRREERQAIYHLIETLKDGWLNDDSMDGEVSAILYALPPPFLRLMSKWEAALVLSERAFDHSVSDAAWEEELRRRRRIEEAATAK